MNTKSQHGEPNDEGGKVLSEACEVFLKMIADVEEGIAKLAPKRARDGLVAYRRAEVGDTPSMQMRGLLAELCALVTDKRDKDLITAAAFAHAQLAWIDQHFDDRNEQPNYWDWWSYSQACRFLGVMQGMRNIVSPAELGAIGGNRRAAAYADKVKQINDLYRAWDAGKLKIPGAKEHTHLLGDFDDYVATKLGVSERHVRSVRSRFGK